MADDVWLTRGSFVDPTCVAVGPVGRAVVMPRFAAGFTVVDFGWRDGNGVADSGNVAFGLGKLLVGEMVGKVWFKFGSLVDPL